MKYRNTEELLDKISPEKLEADGYRKCPYCKEAAKLP